MKTGLLSFVQVCAEYEFAAWELAELVERGEIAATLDGEGEMWFERDEIIRYLRHSDYFISFIVASRICGRTTSNLRQQANYGKLRAKKVSIPDTRPDGGVWMTTLSDVEHYMEEFSRNI